MRYFGCIALLMIVLFVGLPLRAISLPDDGFAEGWAKPVKPLVYSPDGLSDYIDGDAEMFLEMGFRQLQVQQYQNGGNEIDLEVYEFDKPDGALGVYLLRCGKESPSKGVDARNSLGEPQLLAVKGRYFLQVLNYTDGAKTVPVMVQLAQALVSTIPAESSTVLNSLPLVGRQPGSEHVFCGPLSTNAALHIGRGDILQLKGQLCGAAAGFADSSQGSFTLASVTYPDADAAAGAFANLRKNLDPSLQVLSKSATSIIFKDRHSRFGIAELKNTLIEIRTGLRRKPVVGQS